MEALGKTAAFSNDVTVWRRIYIELFKQQVNRRQKRLGRMVDILFDFRDSGTPLKSRLWFSGVAQPPVLVTTSPVQLSSTAQQNIRKRIKGTNKEPLPISDTPSGALIKSQHIPGSILQYSIPAVHQVQHKELTRRRMAVELSDLTAEDSEVDLR